MKVKKMIPVFCGAMMVAGTAFATDGGVPEFDAVGDDSANYFAINNLAQYAQVIANNLQGGAQLNADSDFTAHVESKEYDQWGNVTKTHYMERFKGPTAVGQSDPCFPGYISYFADGNNIRKFHWSIVLQMKPMTDLNIDIYDCVTVLNETDIWTRASQTGRWRMPSGLVFFQSLNPQITVKAHAGFNNDFDSFVMDARILPGLTPAILENAPYTSKALWAEGIVVALPRTGLQNANGANVYDIHEGDRITVDITSPRPGVDVRYGKDSVTIKYVGMSHTGVPASAVPQS